MTDQSTTTAQVAAQPEQITWHNIHIAKSPDFVRAKMDGEPVPADLCVLIRRSMETAKLLTIIHQASEDPYEIRPLPDGRCAWDQIVVIVVGDYAHIALKIAATIQIDLANQKK